MRKRLRTTASRAARHGDPDAYYEGEPSMRLSRAFVVVLILHLVAVGGIFLFNNIKTNQERQKRAALPGVSTAAALAPPALVAGGAHASIARASATPSALPPVDVQRLLTGAPAKTSGPTKISSGPAASPAATKSPAAKVKDSGTVYQVVAGDNPYSIARKYKVGYQDLLTLNGIEDPKNLKIGEKLHIPAARP